MATEFFNEQFLVPASEEPRQKPQLKPLSDRLYSPQQLEDAIARLEASLPETRTVPAARPAAMMAQAPTSQPAAPVQKAPAKPIQPTAQTPVPVQPALAQKAAKGKRSLEEMKAQAERLRAQSQQLQIKASHLADMDAPKPAAARPAIPVPPSQPRQEIQVPRQNIVEVKSQPVPSKPRQALNESKSQPVKAVSRPVQAPAETTLDGKPIFSQTLRQKASQAHAPAANPSEPKTPMIDPSSAPAPYRKPEAKTAPASKPAIAPQIQPPSETRQTPIFRRFDRLAVEQMLTAMYPRIQLHEFLPWQMWHGPLIPDYLVRSIDPKSTRRIVVLGCRDGLLANTLALLFPEIEVVGIDSNPALIEYAQETVGRRTNIQFIHANPLEMEAIPCDRIIYDHCLAGLKSRDDFKTLVAQTTGWLHTRGDFMIKESPLKLALSPAFLKLAFERLKEAPSIEFFMRRALKDAGFSNPLTYRFQKLPFFATEVCYQYPKSLNLTGMLPRPTAKAVAEWQDWGSQSMDSVVGFLFADQKADFRPELSQ